jgi:hypothetical protein
MPALMQERAKHTTAGPEAETLLAHRAQGWRT